MNRETTQTSPSGAPEQKKTPKATTWSCQLIMAVILCLAGLLLLFLGFFCNPQGIIDSSVLIGFGEVSTFAGALFGVDVASRSEKRKVKSEK